MKNIFRFLSVVLLALLGNCAGEVLRFYLSGKDFRELSFVQVNNDGEIVIGLNPTITNFIPALILSLLGYPRWFFAFMGGVFSSWLIGDRYEEMFLALFWEKPKKQQYLPRIKEHE